MLTNPSSHQILQNHFGLLYSILAKNKLIPNASFETLKEEIQRSLSGIPVPYYNAAWGIPQNNQEQCIDEQLKYFNQTNMPFV